MGLEISEFAKIIIADEEYFEKAVDEIKPNCSFTKSEYLTLGGKSFLLSSEHGYKFSLLFNSLNFSVALTDIPEGSDKEFFVLKKFNKNITFHELGHCLDNKFRHESKEYKIRNDDNLFKIQTVCKYYINILIDEIAACYLSSASVDSDVFFYDMNSNDESFQNQIDEKSKILKKYSGNKDELYEIAFITSGIFWFIFIQYGKLIGYKIGNKALGNIDIEFSSINKNLSKSILKQFEEVIKKMWLSYPNINVENTYNELIPIWKNFTMSMGVKFVESENGDGIFW